MQSYLKSPVRDTGSLSQHTHHQYAIDGFGTPNSVRSNVSATSDLTKIVAQKLIEPSLRASLDLLDGTVTSSESTQQHGHTKAPSTAFFSSSEQFAPFLSSSKQFAPFLSASKQNAASKVLSTTLLSSNKGGEIDFDKQQQTCAPTSALDVDLTIPAVGVNVNLNKAGQPSDLMLRFTSVNHATSAALSLTLLATTQQNFQAHQLVLNKHHRHTELSKFAIAQLASDKRMESVSSSRFPPEVDAFTQSYQFAPILPTFSRMPHLSPSDASQPAVSHQLPSDFLSVVEDEHLSSYSTKMEDVGSDIEASPNAAEPLVGLGISFGQSPSDDLFLSPTKALRTSFRRVAISAIESDEVAALPSPSTTTQSTNVESTPKEQGKSSQAINHSNLNSDFTPLNVQGRAVHATEGPPSTLANDGVAASPSLSTTTQSTNVEINSEEQQKSSQAIESSNISSGFTPLNEQGRATHDVEDSPAYKIRTINAATKVLPTAATFGPPLHNKNIEKQGTPPPLTKYGRATALSRISYSPPFSKKVTISLLAFDQQHVDMLLKELEQLSAEDLERFEIRMFRHHEGSTAAQQALLKERIFRDEKFRLKLFLKYKEPSTSKTPEGQRLVKLSPLPIDGVAQPLITLTVLPAPLTEFHIFYRLPPELQQRIWKCSLPGPRTVWLTSPKGRPGLEFFQPKNSPPLILQVCHQARDVALRTLQPAFENPTLLQGARTFFNFEIDTLRLTSGVSIETARAVACSKHPSLVRDRERVRHLEIPFHIGHNMQQYHSLAALIILAPKRGWPGLQTLTFPGCAVTCGNEETYRMPIIEVTKNASIPELMKYISYEFRTVWEEFKDTRESMPDTGLKIVYLEDEDEDQE